VIVIESWSAGRHYRRSSGRGGRGPFVGVGSGDGVGSGVAVASVFPTGVGSSGEAVAVAVAVADGSSEGSMVGPMVTGVRGLIVLASDNRCWTNASTVAPRSEVGGAGDWGIRVARSGASALEQPMVDAAAAITITAITRCFQPGMPILSRPIWGNQ